MQREKAKKNQIVVTMSILLLFLFSFIISSFPVYARSPVVVIQPGHSVGYDPGATNSSTGITEAAVNAAVAGKVATKLKQLGYTVYLTHPVAGCSVQSLLTNVEANSLSNVANAINKIKPDLAISVHHNSGGSSASGYEFYWSSYRDFDQEGVYEVSGLWAGDMAFRDSSPCWAAQESKAFASVLEKNFNGIGIDHRKTVERDDYVQAHVTCPSVLIEGGFISNPSESLLLASDAFQEKMSGRIVNSVSEYFGGATKDEKAPTADSITTPESPTTNAVFTVTANGVKDDLSGVSGVRAAVWCDWNDLKWYPANNIGSGQWSVTVDIKNHEDRVGTYYIDYYATDNAGNDGYIGGETIDIVAVPSISNGVSSVRINNNQFKVYAKGFLNYSNLLFPTWSNNDGMDDIKWYQGVRQTDGSYAILVDNSDHGYDVGKYYTDVYGTDSNGKQVYLGGTTQTIAQMTAKNVAASEVKN
ncbi:GBS Bsp-like repeat-containing protein, partial [Eubacterium callanderi]|uniref:GBS Bsp-like repeat-containing protein n=1 Tax=Eubacterium callanderi TaxID=53442 RepID=UPI00391B8B1F